MTKENWSKVFSNRSIIIGITLFFIVWLVFFDQNNFIRLHGINQEVEKLERECDFYRGLIKSDSTVIAGLEDGAFVEKYARDNFHWHRADEELYILRQKK